MSILDEARGINSTLQRIRESIKVGVLQVESAFSTVNSDGVSIKNSLQEHKHVLKSALESTNIRLRKIKYAEIRERYTIYMSL